MDTETVSSRVRRRLGVKTGQMVHVILYDHRIEMIPVKPAKEMSRLLKGIEPTVERESVDPERNCLHQRSEV